MLETLNQDVENTIFRLLSKFTGRENCVRIKIEEVNFPPGPSKKIILIFFFYASTFTLDTKT